MSQDTYTPTPNPVDPVSAQSPNNLAGINPKGSQYASDYSHAESILIREAVAQAIIDQTPKQYSSLRILMEKPIIYKPSDEFYYLESTFGRSASQAASGVAGVTYPTTQTVTFKDVTSFSVNDILTYPDNTKGIVKSINTSTKQVVMEPQTNATLPAVSTDDYFGLQSPLKADGQNFISHYDRLETVTRRNLVQMTQRAKRWSRVEKLKYQNMGQTDYIMKDQMQLIKQTQMDMFNSFWNGSMGECSVTSSGVTAANQYKAKTMMGIYPQMIASGAQFATATPSTLIKTFETLAFSTNTQAEGETRFIFATDKMLYELSKAYKDTKTRYRPDSRLADMNLYEYTIGTMNFVPVTTALFGEYSMFPKGTGFDQRLFVLDVETIDPVCMTGLAPIETGMTDNKQKGSYRDYTDVWADSCLSLQFNKVTSSFFINGSGF